MTRQAIITTPVNSGSGDPLKVAFDKVNANFVELYGFTPGITGPTFFGVDSGAVNAYVFTHSGTVSVTLTAGILIRFTPLNTNTGAVTVNADGTGAVAAVRANGTACTGGEFSSLGPTVLQYNGAAWQIVSTAGAQPGYERTLAETSANITTIDYTRAATPFDFRRYTAKFDNVTDDTNAIANGELVATQTVSGALGGTCTAPTGISLLSTTVQHQNRVRLLGQNKRGSYFKATNGWSVGAPWNSGTNYIIGNYVTLAGTLYIAAQASLNQNPTNNTSFWLPVSPAVFYAYTGFSGGGVGQPQFDSAMRDCAVDANNLNGLGCVLSSAWQEGCGLRDALLINIGNYGVRFQDGFGGAAYAKIIDSEIFGGTVTGQTITNITQASQAVVTISSTTAFGTNPFVINGYVHFSGVAGMTQINSTWGKCVAIGGSSGAWTGTFNIDSRAYTAYSSGGTANNLRGIDLSSPMGAAAAFMLDVRDTSIAGAATPIGAAIVCNGNSLFVRGAHFEEARAGVLVDGAGHITLEDITGSSTGFPESLVVIGSNFVGTLQMRNCRRNNGTGNFLVDNRVAQISTFGAITGGSLYTNGTYSQVPLTGSATGTDATALIVVSGGAVTSVQVQQPGKNFVVGDVLSAAAANIGGTGSGFSIPVATTFTGLGTITTDNPFLVVNAGDAQTPAFTGISGFAIGAPQSGPALTVTGISGGNIQQWKGVNTSGAVVSTVGSLQLDTTSVYFGTISNNNLVFMLNGSLAAGNINTFRQWTVGTPPSGNHSFGGPFAFTGNIGFNGASPTGQVTGFGTPTGTGVISNFPGATATLAQCSQTIAELIKDLKALGIYGA